MDAQITVKDSAGLVALVQSLVHMEATEGAAEGASRNSAELLAENRFLAARDGMHAHFLDPGLEGQISARRRALAGPSMRARSTPTSSGAATSSREPAS